MHEITWQGPQGSRFCVYDDGLKLVVLKLKSLPIDFINVFPSELSVMSGVKPFKQDTHGRLLVMRVSLSIGSTAQSMNPNTSQDTKSLIQEYAAVINLVKPSDRKRQDYVYKNWLPTASNTTVRKKLFYGHVRSATEQFCVQRLIFDKHLAIT